jgi:hypothetical protein
MAGFGARVNDSERGKLKVLWVEPSSVSQTDPIHWKRIPRLGGEIGQKGEGRVKKISKEGRK